MPSAPRVPSEDLDRLERLLWILSALGFAIALRGWVNDIGEFFIPFGMVAGVVTGVVALLVNATKGQARRVVDEVARNGSKLDRILEAKGSKLDRIEEDLANQHDGLVEIRDHL